MDQSSSSIFDVTIDFSQSHQFFPNIIITLLGLMSVWILAVHLKGLLGRLRSGELRLSLLAPDADKRRFFGTLALVTVYFWSMDQVGQIFPNTGMGFLLCSIPFIFLLSLLYVHDVTRRKLIGIGLNAVIAPVLVWYLLGQLFAVTLP